MSNDLISRSELAKEIDSLRVSITGLRAGKGILLKFMDEYKKSVLKCIEEAPTAYDVDKVCEELEKLKNADIDMSDEEPELMDAEEIYDEGRAQGRVEAYVKAIEVVRNGGKKE